MRLPFFADPGAEATGEPEAREVAVIDIGSNSVRLVHFRVEGRALWPVFNEKTMAGLGRGARETGRLNPDGVGAALRTLKRFVRLMDAKGISTRYAVATAAVRDCADGPAFVSRVFAETGLRIEVLSGPEEGRRSAIGVLAGVGDADGVAGDLGGSSLEFTVLKGRRTGEAVSLPLGPLAVSATETPFAVLKKRIDSELSRAEPMLEGAGPVFYAVGGAWRAFARLSMALDDYPLHLLHQYALGPDQILRAAEFAEGQSETSLAAVPGVSSKRAAMLPYASLLLRRIVKRGRFESVVFSANGLREGVVCASDQRLVLEKDPLISGAEAMARNASPEPEFGAVLADWIAPAFHGEPAVFRSERDQLLQAAAARLADTGARLHPDHRAELVFSQTLYAPLGGLLHGERTFLALALHHRYSGKKSRGEDCLSRRLLDEAQLESAQKLGLALRLGAALSGRSARVLEAFRLERTQDSLTLRVALGSEDLVVERALQRFEQLAAALKLTPRVA